MGSGNSTGMIKSKDTRSIHFKYKGEVNIKASSDMSRESSTDSINASSDASRQNSNDSIQTTENTSNLTLTDKEKGSSVDVDFTHEVHKIFKKYKKTKHQWKRDQLSDLRTKITEITKRTKDVYVTVCIEDKRHTFGTKGRNRITIVLKDKQPFIEHTWDFKTPNQAAKEVFKSVLFEVVNAVKGFWSGIVQMISGLGQAAIQGGAMKAITMA